MRPNQIDDILNLALRARNNDDIFNVLLVSPPGLGKTEIVQQYAKKNNLQCLVLSLSTIDPPDFKGFPIIETINGRQRLSFATPSMWPDGGKGIVVLEELNRASTSVMQCVLSLTDHRRGFDGYKLPDGWIVVGCVNPEGGEYDVNTMDPALKDRFELFQVSYDKKSHVDYMRSTEWHKDVLLFVESGIYNYKTPEEIKNAPGAKYVSPRTLSKLNAALRAGLDGEDEMLVYTSILGNNIGREFYAFRHNESPVMYNDLLNRPNESLQKLKKFSDPKNAKNGMISLTTRDIIDVNEINDDLLADVLEVIPVDMGTSLLRELEYKRQDKELTRRIIRNNANLKELYKATYEYGKK